MNIASKRTAALELLARTGMRRSSYEPPLLRLLWRVGMDSPPPHFASFGQNLVIAGIYFGVAWGLGWAILAKVILDIPGTVVWAACAAGLLFGLSMATYYAYGARKYHIPRWATFDGDASGT
jgi:hypothetical protein